jgi:hypothetical protein
MAEYELYMLPRSPTGDSGKESGKPALRVFGE